jgi:enoyl-CoA hydratase
MSDSPGLLVEHAGDVLIVTINRPQARNAIDLETAVGIAAAMDRLDAEESLGACVLTGAGGYFSAGMDLKAFAETGKSPRVPGRGFAGLVERPPQKPLIAAIEGFALGGGFELALACDLIVAARGARLGLPEVRRGLVASGGGLLRLQQFLPRPIAMELALTGEPLLAERALEFGLVNALCEPGAAREAAIRLAATIAANAPLSVRTTKAVLLQAPTWAAGEAWAEQAALTDPVFASEDAREGAAAFAAKRTPRWRGR